MPMAAMLNASMVRGILFPIPAISLILVLPVATNMAPAQRKRVIFMYPWNGDM